MADDRNVHDLWQSQSAGNFQMTTEEIHMKIEQLDRASQQKTRGGYLVCGFLILFFSLWAIVEHDPLMRAGALLTIAAVLFLGVQLQRNRVRKPDSARDAAVPSVDHLRAELARQRDFHRGRPFWSRLLFLTSAGLFFSFGFARAHPEVVGIIRWEALAIVLLMIAAVPLNLGLSRRYQRQIDELDRQKESA